MALEDREPALESEDPGSGPTFDMRMNEKAFKCLLYAKHYAKCKCKYKKL